ncbi:MAG: hypothetical protein JWQ38_1064, partial [Flavipsychrobacter sp.]|nr:hypothetical protein [Flavipsychrobacter sp.]
MNTSCSRFVLFIIAHMLCATQAFAQAKAFAFTGNVQTFVIPDNVISISIDIAGGTGGSSYFSKGGFGGRVQCRMSVTPGEVLNIFIGGAGKESSRKMPAGFNGGSPDMDDMAGGGGASDIRVGGTALSNRVVVAGGGGGASYHFNKKDSERGGAGGGLKGGNGYYNSSNKVTSYGGGGGTV